MTYAELDTKARAAATVLQAAGATGQRALLLYPPGLDYIVTFLGCLYAGVVAVPAYPPGRHRMPSRIRALVADAQPAIGLIPATVAPIIEAFFTQAPELTALSWLAIDGLAANMAEDWRDDGVTGDSVAFLQYTSGSTATPKGVMLTHSSLLHNLALIQQAFELSPDHRGVSWLPPYHDMGLIGCILAPLYAGFPVVLLSPLAFLHRPFRWLEAISRYRATISGAPNFAYDLCVRRVTSEERAILDLSSWRVAFNGAEPIRAETLDRFVATFGPHGFRREAFFPCYGLAEATLIVSAKPESSPPVVSSLSRAALERHSVSTAVEADEDTRRLVSCGVVLKDQHVVIVHQDSGTPSAPDQIGEIWVSGPSIARGYWNRAGETEQAFGARLDASGDRFLRTGDLGFLKDGELFVTGRLKDLIIIRGRNHYPHDIESTVERSHPALRPNGGVTFSIEVAGEERLVVVQEVEGAQSLDLHAVTAEIVRAISEEHHLQPYAVVLVGARTIPKTSSGKQQRLACRTLFLEGDLDVLAEWRAPVPGRPPALHIPGGGLECPDSEFPARR